jgi:hypothetical protein
MNMWWWMVIGIDHQTHISDPDTTHNNPTCLVKARDQCLLAGEVERQVKLKKRKKPARQGVQAFEETSAV